ncbi:trimethylamine methyltransferase family protein [Sporomusa ovata]|uniref:Trimethylamine:corrinoid methyltransferase @ pyrrolysine-containing n=1 Tax=Sporomusa ovata TaxID=2378 RepID=A0A0U1L256_9FIRM|nr:trimethylamine methyltransferase family protein [Sporomusa ovata]CQR73742.1 Trimethylamine:corrinoid methyltransferase @ pyrrolysine-containing [Sporomusa ovata]
MNTTRSRYTRANYAVNQTTAWEMLSEDQSEELFMTTLEVLERTGVEILNQEARGIFEKAGCWVDGNRVRIPSAVTEMAVKNTPSRVTVCDRNGKRALKLETTNAYYGPGQGNVYVLDPMTSDWRKPVKEDVAKTAIVCDGLQNIDFVMNNGLPTDVNASTAEVHAFEALITNTTKPIIQAIPGVKQAQAILDIAAAVAGSLREFQKNPFAVFLIETEGTLVHSEETLAKVLFAARNGVPYVYATKLIAGETSPVTPAGAIVVALADVLVGIVLGQLVRQGAPVIAGGFFTIKNQETGIISYGAPEISLMGTGMANVLRFLRIPSFGFAGATDAKVSDAQMGLEAAFSILHAGMSGTSLIYGCGQLEYGQTGSLELLVMGDEVMGMTRRMMKGVEVNEERMARGVIDAVQPGGHYLGEDHTLKYFRTETWWPTVMNRARIADWEANGSKSLGQRVKEKTQSIINTHQSEKLSAEVLSKIQTIVNGADAR